MGHEIRYNNVHEANSQMIDWDLANVEYIHYHDMQANQEVLIFVGFKQEESNHAK